MKIYYRVLTILIVAIAMIPSTIFAATLITPQATDPSADVGEPVMIASLSVDNFTYSYDDVLRKIQIGFDLSNEDQSLNNVSYSLIVSSDNGAEKSFIYNKNLYISSNGIVHQDIMETIPDYIFGNVKILLQVNNANGIPLGVRMRDGITVSKIISENSIHIDSKSCYLTVSGKTKYNLIQGVDVDPTEQLFLNCGVIGSIKTPYLLILPSMKTYERSTAGNMLNESTLESISYKNSDTTIKIPVKIPTKPQAYSSIISLNSGSQSIGDVEFHYVVRGESGTTNFVQTDKMSYIKGDTAQVKILWSPRADYYPGTRATTTVVTGSYMGNVYMTANEISCGEPVSFEASKANEQEIEVNVPIMTDCNGFTTKIEIKDASTGNVIAASSFNTPIDPTVSKSGWIQYVIAIGSLIIAIIFIVILVRLKRKHVDSKVLLLIFFLGASFGIVQVVRAYTLTAWFAVDGYLFPVVMFGDFEVYRSSDSASSGFKVGDTLTVHDYKSKTFIRCYNGGYDVVHSKVTVTGPNGQTIKSTAYRQCDSNDGTYCINDLTFTANSVGVYQITVTFHIVDSQGGISKDIPFTKTITIVPETTTPPASLLPVNNITSSIGSCGSKIVNLSWDIMSGATQYVITRTGSGSARTDTITQPTSGTRVNYTDRTVADGALYQYSVQARYATGLSTARTLNVTSPAACGQPTVSLVATPDSVAVGGVSTLTWASQNATSCTTSGDWRSAQTSTASPFGGVSTGVLNTQKTYTYNIVCTGPAGTSPISTATVIAVPPNCIANPEAPSCPLVTVAEEVPDPICNMTANPPVVAPGEPTILTWSSRYATICTTPGIPSSGNTQNGQAVVYPTAGNNSYTFSCSNSATNNICNSSITVDVGGNDINSTGASSDVYLWFGNRPTPLVENPDDLGHMNNQLPLTIVQGENVKIKYSWPSSIGSCSGYELSGPNMTTSQWLNPLSLGDSRDSTVSQNFGLSTLSNLPTGTYKLGLICKTDRNVTDANGVQSTITDTSLSANSIRLYVIQALIHED